MSQALEIKPDEIAPDEITLRINDINNDLRIHRKNIKLLNMYATEIREAKTSPFAPRVIKYTCIPRSEKRFRGTLENIKRQVEILERELETLIKYGKRGG